MFKKALLAGIATIMIFAVKPVNVMADEATADSMIPTLRMLYHVDAAEQNLLLKKDALNNCIISNASVYETAKAQAEVNAAANLLNSLNVMIARDMNIIGAAPAGVVNPPSFAINNLLAQNAWYDAISLQKSQIYPYNYPTGNILHVNMP